MKITEIIKNTSVEFSHYRAGLMYYNIVNVDDEVT